MRVTVDPWKCQSNLVCIGLAPDVFTYDDEHSYAIIVSETVDDARLGAVRDAVTACPEGAITIEP